MSGSVFTGVLPPKLERAKKQALADGCPGGHNPSGTQRDTPRSFMWANDQEPHIQRRLDMLKKYPEIKKLYGYDHETAYWTFFYVGCQLLFSVISQDMSWPAYIAVAYVGGFMTHSLMLGIHEITHNLAFKSLLYNELLGYVANIPMVFPYAMMFKYYHAEHHRYLGWDHVDTDVPSDIELTLLQSFWGKLFFLIFQIPFYAFRPTVIRAAPFTRKVAENWVFNFGFSALWALFFGWRPIAYLIFSMLLGGSIGPFSGHFISEHYIFDEEGKQETYSYYGFWNPFHYNVGYHNEHHDFPNIPHTRLHQLHDIAPEFYAHLKTTPSWFAASMRFLMDPKVGIWARIKRERLAHKRTGPLIPTTPDYKPFKPAR